MITAFRFPTGAIQISVDQKEILFGHNLVQKYQTIEL